MQKNTKKKIAPVVIAVLVVAYVAPLLSMVAYAAGLLGAEVSTAPGRAGAPPPVPPVTVRV